MSCTLTTAKNRPLIDLPITLATTSFTNFRFLSLIRNAITKEIAT